MRCICFHSDELEIDFWVSPSIMFLTGFSLILMFSFPLGFDIKKWGKIDVG